MMQAGPHIEECCSWCRQPIEECRDSSCDDAGTYSGVLDGGEWKEVPDGREKQAALKVC